MNYLRCDKDTSIKVSIAHDSMENYKDREFIDYYGIGGNPNSILRIGNLYIEMTNEMEEAIRKWHEDT